VKFISDSAVVSESAMRGLQQAESCYVGHHAYIGPGVKIRANRFALGDYSKIHDGTFIYTQEATFPGGYVLLGHNTWIGQNAVIDGTGSLIASNNLGVGMGSQLYSHINNGEWLGGCRLCGTKKMSIHDDVWFVGQCLVSPIVAKSRSVALLGSVVTRDMAENRIYGGSPAEDMTDRLGRPYRDASVDARVQQLNEWRTEFFDANPRLDRDSIVVTDTPVRPDDDRTMFDVSSRTYVRHDTEAEVAFMKWISGFRAKFTDVARPIESIFADVLRSLDAAKSNE